MTRNIRLALTLLLVTPGLMGCASAPTNKNRPPDDPSKVADLNTQLAIAYVRDGENELALKKLERAVSVDPNYAPAYSTMGLLYNRVGAFDKADSNFRKALRLDPENSSILNNYGQVLCQHGQYGKGQEMFLKANENLLYRSPEIAFSNAGTCALAAGDVQMTLGADQGGSIRIPAAWSGVVGLEHVHSQCRGCGVDRNDQCGC